VTTPRTLVWFREHDLRLADHEPRRAAAAGEIVPLFVLEPSTLGPARARARAHRAQFLLESLGSLADELAARGTRLLVVEGPAESVVPRLVHDWRVDRVVAHRVTDPAGRERDRRLLAALGGQLELFAGETLVPPGTLRSGAGTPYSVFTAFARAWRRAVKTTPPLPAPRALSPLPAGVGAGARGVPTLAELGITRNPALQPGGERAAKERLRRFLRSGLRDYAARRDRLDLAGTSRLSADLVMGTLSVRQLWAAIDRAPGGGDGAEAFRNELVWREFAHSTLWDRPDLLERPFRPAWAGFPWRRDEAAWRAWVEGRTGYPVVDAAARQLLGEGFVHNRARMIAASFLTKHLLFDFRRGEAHYLAHLTDGDPANNDAGWQWSAGCGADAQPYYRVFNPVLQGERFDPEGDYVRRWLPELARLPRSLIHRPWEAPPAALKAAGLRLGADYPRPIVPHRFVRERFLEVVQRHLGVDVARPQDDG